MCFGVWDCEHGGKGNKNNYFRILQHQVNFLRANKMLRILSMFGLRARRSVARRVNTLYMYYYCAPWGGPTFWLGTRRRWVTATASQIMHATLMKCHSLALYLTDWYQLTKPFSSILHLFAWDSEKTAIWALRSRCQRYELPGGRVQSVYASVHVLLTVVAGAWWTSAIGVEITNEC